MSQVAHVHLKAGGNFVVKFTYYDSQDVKPKDVDWSEVNMMRVTSSQDFVSFSRISWIHFYNLFRGNRLPNLESLSIAGDTEYGELETDLCIEPLAQIIRTISDGDTNKIKNLTVTCKNLTGVAGEDDGWELFRLCCRYYLKGLTSLDYSRNFVGINDEIQALETTMCALLSIPTLEHVELHCEGRQDLNLSPATLTSFANCHSLKSLELSCCTLSDSQIRTLCAVLNLKSTHKLFHLELRINDNLTNPVACGEALSKMVQQMPFGLSIELYSSGRSLQDEFLCKFGEGLRSLHDSSVETLAFYFQLSEKVQVEYLDIFKQNYTLRNLKQWKIYNFSWL